jgi:hypothetical protein
MSEETKECPHCGCDDPKLCDAVTTGEPTDCADYEECFMCGEEVEDCSCCPECNETDCCGECICPECGELKDDPDEDLCDDCALELPGGEL